MDISSIEDVIRYNCFRWFGHLKRVDEEKWPRMVLNFEINDSYSWDRPKKRWFDNIICDLDKLQLLTSLALNPLMPSGNKKFTHTKTNLQLSVAGLSMCDLFGTARH